MAILFPHNAVLGRLSLRGWLCLEEQVTFGRSHMTNARPPCCVCTNLTPRQRWSGQMMGEVHDELRNFSEGKTWERLCENQLTWRRVFCGKRSLQSEPTTLPTARAQYTCPDRVWLIQPHQEGGGAKIPWHEDRKRKQSLPKILYNELESSAYHNNSKAKLRPFFQTLTAHRNNFYSSSRRVWLNWEYL